MGYQCSSLRSAETWPAARADWPSRARHTVARAKIAQRRPLIGPPAGAIWRRRYIFHSFTSASAATTTIAPHAPAARHYVAVCRSRRRDREIGRDLGDVLGLGAIYCGHWIRPRLPQVNERPQALRKLRVLLPSPPTSSFAASHLRAFFSKASERTPPSLPSFASLQQQLRFASRRSSRRPEDVHDVHHQHTPPPAAPRPRRGNRHRAGAAGAAGERRPAGQRRHLQGLGDVLRHAADGVRLASISLPPSPSPRSVSNRQYI